MMESNTSIIYYNCNIMLLYYCCCLFLFFIISLLSKNYVHKINVLMDIYVEFMYTTNKNVLHYPT